LHWPYCALLKYSARLRRLLLAPLFVGVAHKEPVNYAGRAVGRLYRHVGLNLYDQPLSRGHISSAIAAVVGAPSPSPLDCALETSAAVAAETSLVVDVAPCRVIRTTGQKRGKRDTERERERERETQIASDTDAKHEGNVMFDVIPGRNPGGARESVNRRVRASAFRRGTKTTPVTSARLERGGNARGASYFPWQASPRAFSYVP